MDDAKKINRLRSALQKIADLPIIKNEDTFMANAKRAKALARRQRTLDPRERIKRIAIAALKDTAGNA